MVPVEVEAAHSQPAAEALYGKRGHPLTELATNRKAIAPQQTLITDH